MVSAMSDKSTTFPIESVTATIVPTHLYDYTLDLSLSTSCIVHIKDADIGRPGSPIGLIPMQIIPEFRLTMKAIQAEYDLSQKDAYATLIVFGLSIFQHRYSPDLKRYKEKRLAEFFSGTKKDELVEKFGTCSHFFEKSKNGRGGRKQVNLLGDREDVMAPIGDNAEFFNLSVSDMAHVILSHALVRWDKLPADFKGYFEKVNDEFETHAKNFYAVHDEQKA